MIFISWALIISIFSFLFRSAPTHRDCLVDPLAGSGKQLRSGDLAFQSVHFLREKNEGKCRNVSPILQIRNFVFWFLVHFMYCWVYAYSFYITAIYSCGALSGAHFNPAVTLSLALFRRRLFNWKALWYYVIAQFIGAMLAGEVCDYPSYFFIRDMVTHDRVYVCAYTFFTVLDKYVCFFSF